MGGSLLGTPISPRKWGSPEWRGKAKTKFRVCTRGGGFKCSSAASGGNGRPSGDPHLWAFIGVFCYFHETGGGGKSQNPGNPDFQDSPMCRVLEKPLRITPQIPLESNGIPWISTMEMVGVEGGDPRNRRVLERFRMKKLEMGHDMACRVPPGHSFPPPGEESCVLGVPCKPCHAPFPVFSCENAPELADSWDPPLPHPPFPWWKSMGFHWIPGVFVV